MQRALENAEQHLARVIAEIAIQHRLSDDDMIGLLIQQLAEWRKFGEAEKAA
jgi:hypothetical protein